MEERDEMWRNELKERDATVKTNKYDEECVMRAKFLTLLPRTKLLPRNDAKNLLTNFSTRLPKTN